MSKAFIRIWQELDTEDIKKHLVVVGQVSGSCENCNELGIDYQTAKNCPNCNTEFKFISLRPEKEGKDIGFSNIRLIKQRCPDLIFIEYSDFKKFSASQKAQDIFGD
jgi:Zn finger protein HypA/HybF involved in hydrogenase expression